MPKIKDLGISAIPLAREEHDRDAPMYWMCLPQWSNNTPPEPCHPTPPQCHPTPTPKPAQDRALPHDAVVQLRQQFRQQISR
jgi:hypothetical protein